VSVRDLYAQLGVTLGRGDDRNAAARCFANPDAHRHDDRNASCSVSLSTGAWKCHACGAHGGAYDACLAHRLDPAQAMDALRRHDLADDDQPAPARATPRQQPPAPVTAATPPTAPGVPPKVAERLHELRGWTAEAIRRLDLRLNGDRVVIPLTLPDGSPAGELRYQPNPLRRNGQPKMLAAAGTQRCLYPPPERVTGDPLWIVEGEPDAISAASIDLPAVAVPGANGWRDEWAPRFAERRVVICTDCDQPGRTLAQQVAAALTPVAAEVRVLDLATGRSDGFDLGDLVHDGRDQPVSVRRLLHAAARETKPVARDGGRHAQRIERWQRILTEIIDGHADDTAPIPLPFPALNTATYGGLRPGELVVVAGYTGHGKSVLADMVLDHAAAAGYRCHLYMTEMTLRDRGERLLARRTGVPFGRIRSRNLRDHDRDELRHAIEALDYGATLAADWSVEQVCEDIARCGWDLAVVDLLHGFPYDGERELTAHVKALATAARASTNHGPGTCLLLACHLNDGQMAGRRELGAPKPGKHSLKGASSIRQDADTIILTWLKEDEHGVAGTDGEVWIAKGRNSGGRSVAVELDATNMRFRERTATPTFAEAVA
jgi:hypothetical protein